MTKQAVFIDPSSEHFLCDRLFNLEDSNLNRDGTLIPFVLLREYLAKQGIPVFTADKLRDGSERRDLNHYWSLGLIDSYQDFVGDPAVRLSGFILFEPPLVLPKVYSELPKLTSHFEKVFVHNIIGDGYSLEGVCRDRLRKLHWPQPYADVLPQFWNNKNRINKLVVVAGNHNPGRYSPEFYSERIKAIAALSERGGIDLFGRGWDRWWSRQSMWWPYWRYRSHLVSCYQGSCESKWEVLSRYRFSLCFENMPMAGYITEKIFDCFYAGTVPVYLGAPDVDAFIPTEAFVDMRRFSTYQEMFDYILSISDQQWHGMREAARDFLRTRGATEYYDSLLHMVRT